MEKDLQTADEVVYRSFLVIAVHPNTGLNIERSLYVLQVELNLFMGKDRLIQLFGEYCFDLLCIRTVSAIEV
ncbi:hypothetical protein PaeBR_08700 [Paenibacillus sp. BR2-3]|uniref:hypothetical protein n=1 Tax=Paenibacillus sp. BR2-3 TaxID=3048494 RepID=UPI0039779555